MHTNIFVRNYKSTDIVEKRLNRKLSPNEIIYYFDGDINNIKLSNLIVMSKKNRDSLELFIKSYQKKIFKVLEFKEKHWNNLRMMLIVLWVRRNRPRIIKIWNVKNKKVTKKQGLHSINNDNHIITCLYCKKSFIPKRNKIKFCSLECSHRHASKFLISKEELEELVWEMSVVNIAKKFNVSESSVDIRIKRLGILKPPNGYWRRNINKINQVNE